MDAFLINISSFPTAIYTTGLVVVAGYWLIALVGLFDIDLFAVEVDVDIDVDSDVGNVGTIAGLLTTLGLNGVPITVVISLLILNSWFICYFLVLFVPGFPEFISIIQMLIHLAIAVISFMLSIPVTAFMIRPLRGIFRRLNQEPIRRSLIGATCRVRSSRVDHSFGEAECIHYGASIIIKIRSVGDRKFSTGESVSIIEHNKDEDNFIVVSQKEFEEQTGG